MNIFHSLGQIKDVSVHVLYYVNCNAKTQMSYLYALIKLK